MKHLFAAILLLVLLATAVTCYYDNEYFDEDDAFTFASKKPTLNKRNPEYIKCVANCPDVRNCPKICEKYNPKCLSHCVRQHRACERGNTSWDNCETVLARCERGCRAPCMNDCNNCSKNCARSF